jgi:hypothetical protein
MAITKPEKRVGESFCEFDLESTVAFIKTHVVENVE